MATPKRPEQDRDENQEVANTPPPNGEDLLADPELQHQLREAKEQEKNPNGEN